MIEDFDTSDDGVLFEADVCIVGAGAAGITVARSLLDSGLDVLLMESGGKDFEKPARDLAEGESVGFPYYPLEESRLRFFGGTVAVWGGRSAQLDGIDFRERGWVKHSGWPFGKDLLRPYYRKAQALLGLSPVEDNTLPDYESDLKRVEPAFFQFDEQFDRFTFDHCDDLTSSPNVRVLLHATAVKLVPSANGRTIESVEIANLRGGSGTVRAKACVIATGGLEVPRLLLASKHDTHPDGVGNNQDLVGRFFMEHPHARGAQILTKDALRLFEVMPRFVRRGGERLGMLFHPSEELQAEEGILNSCFTLAVRRHPGENQILYKQVYNNLRHELSPTRFGRGLWKLSRRASVYTQEKIGPFLTRRKLRKQDNGIYAVIRAEQAPNPDSRITLSDQRDALGVPRISLDWQLSEIDKLSVERLVCAFGGELERLGLGTVEPAAWLSDRSKGWESDQLVSNHAIGGYHHMGTTRMATSANRGVVDEDCRVYGVDNLYVAGSSVFPTGGWANPTLTIIALAIRLAEQLEKTCSSSAPVGWD